MNHELGHFLDAQERLKQLPARRKMKLKAIAYLAGKFEAEKPYAEREVNEVLNRWHTFGDPATLRRELYQLGFLDRTADGREYRLAQPQPTLEELEKRYG